MGEGYTENLNLALEMALEASDELEFTTNQSGEQLAQVNCLEKVKLRIKFRKCLPFSAVPGIVWFLA